jgi:nicotinamide-nucleotide amidase
MKQNTEQQIKALILSATATAAIEEWKEVSNSQKKPLYDYRGDHVEHVVSLARQLAIESNADLEVVTLAAWFHDFSKPGIGGLENRNHGVESAASARAWLQQRDYNPSLVDRVCDAIEKHVGLTLKKPLQPIEAQVLWEADKLLKLGLIGLLHYILNGIRIEPGNSLSDFHHKLVEFLPLASKIAGSMSTPKGKELASERLSTLYDLSGILESELHLDRNEPSSKKSIRTAGIIAIGNEVLDGLVLDTNSNWLETRLVRLGLQVKRLVSVRDEVEEIGRALAFAGEVCDVIITTGGLGPTHDDMTLKAVGKALNRNVTQSPEALEIVQRQYRYLYQKGIVNSPDMTEARTKMAQIPEGAMPLDNKVGGAPGVMIQERKSTLFCLPGVPSELKFIFEDSIVPWLKERVSWRFCEQVVEFGMHDESVFAPAIDAVMKKHPDVYIKSMPKTYGTSKTLRVWISMGSENESKAKKQIEAAVRDLENVTGIKTKVVEDQPDSGR